MKKVLLGLVIIVAFLAAVVVILCLRSRPPQPQPLPEPPPGAIVFDMTYKGLSGQKDTLRYNMYWFGGHEDSNTRFIRAVRKRIKSPHTIKTVFNSDFHKAQWSALEHDGQKPLAFYFDLNANGRLNENEKILPMPEEDPKRKNSYEFVTPDFLLKTEDKRLIPFRALLQINFHDPAKPPDCMWSPSCILEGTTQIGPKHKKLILFTSGFEPSFKEYGSSSYALLDADEQIKNHVSRSPLSSLINYDGTFYRMKLYGRHTQNSIVRVVLEKDTSPTGTVAVSLEAKESIESSLIRATIRGANDRSIYFNIKGQSTLPQGKYKLDRGDFRYGKENLNWQLTFSQGPQINIEPNEICRLALGKPTIKIRAIDENKRYERDAKEASTFTKGTKIHLSPVITGKTGEILTRFQEKEQQGKAYINVEPTIKITDAKNNIIVEQKMEYG